MRQRKFIIIKDWSGKNIQIRFGWCFFHRDLMTRNDDRNNIDCYGGGKWECDYENKTIRLYGYSDDFGKPNKKDIETAIKNFNNWYDLTILLERSYEEEIPDADFARDIKDYKFIIDY